MVQMVKVFGVEEIKTAMKKANLRLGHSFGRGLLKGGLFLQRESQKIVPVQLSNLKGSAGTRAIGSGWLMAVYVFYTAAYAVYVHERTDAVHGKEFNIKYADKIAKAVTSAQKKIWFKRGPNQQAKFLEKPAREQKDKILRIIAGEAEKI